MKKTITAKLITAAALFLCAGIIGGCTDIAGKISGGTSENASEETTMNELGRTVINFDKDWKFLKLTQAEGLSKLAVEDKNFDDSSWESVDLPHTWNAVDGADGRNGTDEGGEHYYRGMGGYRKKHIFPSELSGKRLFMEFEGANTVAELYINGKFVGKHEGGYSAFRFDITSFVRLGKENDICVKVNNAPSDHIAPITDQGDFTKMGGIYRNVSVIAVDPLHIDLMDSGSPGVYITPENISDSGADIGVFVKLKNDGDKDTLMSVLAEISDADGNTVVSAKEKEIVIAGKITDHIMSLFLPKPHLWDGVTDPYLYTAKVTLLGKDGTLLDEVSVTFGVRTYSIDPEKGFFLNGRYYDLHGVNYHQDSFENGWAMTDSERERDYKMMLDMGCTAVRMAHYQHDGYEYDLCDKLGITVWTEIGIVNKMFPDETDELIIEERFTENAKRQLTELIRQNYNHPSVIVWGISNELHQMSDEIYGIYTELNELANAEDNTRLITFADSQFWGKFLELPADVVGYNRYFGWYKEAGPAEKFGEWLDSYHGAKETRPVCVSEYGGGAAVSQHKDNIDWLSDIDPWGTRHYENYQSAMHEKIWAQFSQRQYLWGKYIWCMFDFASDGREEGDTKGQNDKGLCTRERVPKDAYYFYKSVWNDEPMLHLTEKRFSQRPSLVPTVKAYSNAEKAELFVDGISMGSGEKNGTVFTWENIRIKEGGKSEIKVVAALKDGSLLEDRAEWTGYCVEPKAPMVNVAHNRVYTNS